MSLSQLCLVASTFVAFLVNLSFFLASRKTSPLSVNVLGYLKTVLVMVGGMVLFGGSHSPQNVLGVLVTLLGLAWYTYTRTHIVLAESGAELVLAGSTVSGNGIVLENMTASSLLLHGLGMSDSTGVSSSSAFTAPTQTLTSILVKDRNTLHANLSLNDDVLVVLDAPRQKTNID